MIAHSLRNLLLVEDRLRAARAAAALPQAGKALTEEQVGLFLEAVRLEREPNAFVAAVLALLVPDAGERAADGMIDALASKLDPRALDMLTQLCRSLAPSRLQGLAGDPRWKVRYAAVGALALAPASSARAMLLPRLKDEEIHVRAAAAEALARFKDPAVLATLAGLSSERSSEMRATAAYAYGLLGGARGLQGVRPLLYTDPQLRVRTRAIQGLVDGADPGASELLIGVFARETDSVVRAAAARGVVAMENPEIVRQLIARLQQTPSASPERVAIVNVLARFRSDQPLGLLQAVLAGDDLLSADAAALGLARRWDDSALGQLIRMAEAGRNARAAIRHLQLLSSWANDAESFKRQAANYKGWYKINSTGNPRLWFRDALTAHGYDTSVLGPLMKETAADIPPVPDAAVPLLLRVLRNENWYLRHNASFLLNRRLGSGAPEILSYNTLPSNAEASIRTYHDWWAKEQKRKQAKQRG